MIHTSRVCRFLPVLDADGHWLEFGPSINDYLKEVAGQQAVDSFRRRAGYLQKSLTMTPEERAQTRRAQEAFWGVPAKNTLDRATALLPRLLYNRLDEFGFDFTVLYPTAGLAIGYIPDYSDLIGHWKKRNRQALEEVNPANLDRPLLRELFERFGDSQLAARLDRSTIFEGLGATGTGNIKDLDDFSACGIEHPEDVRELFTRNFYFGCEADDPINAWAFNSSVNPYGARIRALLGSDIGHFDVVNMNEVLQEAYELVGDGLITEKDFREFVFTNPLRFWAEGNPDFFKGTVLEDDAARELHDSPSSR